MQTFSQFKAGIGGAFAEDLLHMKLTDIATWDDFREAALENRATFSRPDDDDPRFGFYDHIGRRYGVASTGEQMLILAILHTIDYDAVADNLAAEYKRSFFDLLGSADVNFRAAAAACIARVN